MNNTKNSTKVQVEKGHYNFSSYIDKERFMSFYYQLQLINEVPGTDILEVGTGSNFLKRNLDQQYNYHCLDFDLSLKPDIAGSVTDLPLKDDCVDIAACFQVLEHLDFSLFEKSLLELKRIAKKNVIVSLPYKGYFYYFSCRVPVLKTIKLELFIPKFFFNFRFKDQHHWEIGYKGFPLKRIKNILQKHFHIRKIIHPSEHKYHIFFALEKK